MENTLILLSLNVLVLHQRFHPHFHHSQGESKHPERLGQELRESEHRLGLLDVLCLSLYFRQGPLRQWVDKQVPRLLCTPLIRHHSRLLSRTDSS